MQAYPLQPIAQRSQPGIFRLNATKDLFKAIRYADEADAPGLIEIAIANGANIKALDFNGLGVLEQAVINNKIRVLKLLLAKGVTLPIVEPNGYDLLMLAASKGYTEMAAALIDIAGMSKVESDKNGKTALHYAVINQHLQTAALLIEQGSDLNAKTKSMSASELNEIFGDAHNLSGANITPFMIAVAQGDYGMVKLFFSKDESIEAGAKHPLLLALKNNDSQMLNIFFENGMSTNYCNLPQNQTLLEHALITQVNKNCLKILLTIFPLDKKNTQYNQSLLSIAVKTENYSAVSLLIEHGVKLNNVVPRSNIWQVAANLPDAQKMLTLLAKSESGRWQNITIGDEKNLLNLICETEPSLAAYASIGILPLTAQKLLISLAQSRQHPKALTNAQRIIEAAQFLEEIAPPANSTLPLADKPIQATSLLSQDSWIELSNAHSAEQITSLKKIGQIIKQNFLEQLQAYLTSEFFASCDAESHDPNQVMHLIKTRLEATLGLPAIAAEIIADGWNTATKLIQSSNIVGSDTFNISELKYQLAHNLIVASIDKIMPVEDVFAQRSLQAIKQCIMQTDAPLDALCDNPIKVLRNVEKRSNLQAVDIPSLKAALCVKFGLPPDLSEILVQCWSGSVNEVRNSHNWHNPTQMHIALQKTLRLTLQNKIMAFNKSQPADSNPLQSEISRKLLQWCEADETMRTEVPGKRAYRTNDGLSSPSKKPRTEN